LISCSIRKAGITCKTVGLGATPSASHPSPLMKDLTELHPGNYLFYGMVICWHQHIWWHVLDGITNSEFSGRG